MTDLTTAQKRYVHEIYNAGVKAYNGRAQRVLQALEDKGLAEWEMEMAPTPTASTRCTSRCG